MSIAVSIASLALSANVCLYGQATSCSALATGNYYALGDPNQVSTISVSDYNRLLRKDQEASREASDTIKEMRNTSRLKVILTYFYYRDRLARTQKSLEEVREEIQTANRH